jgi:hypothetical protein
MAAARGKGPPHPSRCPLRGFLKMRSVGRVGQKISIFGNVGSARRRYRSSIMSRVAASPAVELVAGDAPGDEVAVAAQRQFDS